MVKQFGIGLIGLGGIAMQHLQAYRQRGLSVVGGADISEARREAVRSETDLKLIEADYRTIIDHPDVRVLDINVPHDVDLRRPIIEYAAKANKPMLIQKPLAQHLHEAVELAAITATHDTPAMVNQNSLFVPAFVAMEPYLRDGKHIGTPYYCQIENRGWFDASNHPWFGKSNRWIISDMAIHHLALVRHWFGDAASVSAIRARDSSQFGVVGETLAVIMITFKNGVKAVIINNWCYRGNRPRPHAGEEIVIQGDLGAITLDSNEVCVSSFSAEPQTTFAEFEGTWFPDAFGASMHHFIDALSQEKPFLCDIQDNLKTVAIMEAAYEASETNRSIDVDDVLARHRATATEG